MIGDYESSCCKPGCHGRVCLAGAVYRRALETKETFYCSAGHAQCFTGKSEKDLEIERLRESSRRLLSRVETLARELGECPWPGCESVLADRRCLKRHLQRVHGMPTLAEVRAEEETAA